MDNRKDTIVFPNYSKNNVLNFISSLLAHYNAKYSHNIITNLNLSSNKILIFLLDAMGYDQFISEYPLLNPIKLTTVFPSTTATALTSIFTDKEPIDHGVLGYTTYLQEYGLIANCISMKSTIGNLDVSKYFFQDHTIFTSLSSVDVSSYSLLPNAIFKSGLSQILYTGSKVIPYYSFEDIFTILRDLKNIDSKHLIFVYYPNYDTICHKYGPNSKNAKNELRKLIDSIVTFSHFYEDYNIFIFADHGQIDIPKNSFHFWNEYSNINSTFVIPPFCEPRVNMFFTREDVTKIIKNTFKNIFLINRDEILNSSLFGRGSKFKNRLGDFLLTFYDKKVLMSQVSPLSYPPYFLGMHGSFSKEEMYIPLIQIK